jgi:hypothetical protein
MSFRPDVLLPNVVKRLAKNELLPRKLASRVKCTSFPASPFPVHSREAKEAARIEKEKAAAAAAFVKTQQQAAAAEQKRLQAEQCAERELEIAVKHEYASVLGYNMATESIKKKRVLGGQDDNEQQDEESPAKKLKLSCPTESILSYAQRVHQQRWIEIN